MAEKKKDKKILLSEYLKNSYTAFGVISTLILIILLTLCIVYFFYQEQNILISLVVLLPTLLIGDIIYIYLISRTSYRIFYSSLFENTLRNLENLQNKKIEFSQYEENNIEDLKILNNKLKQISKTFSQISILDNRFSYDSINLEYINKAKATVTDKSFIENIRDIINISHSFRNAIIKVNYEQEDQMDLGTINEIVNIIHEVFNDKGLLIAINSKNDGFIVYTPDIDSISNLSEKLNQLLVKGTISAKTINGIILISPKINCVIYPFTQIEDIESDLLYSSNQNKQINIYIPDKYYGSANSDMLSTSMDINNVSKILGNITSLHETSLVFSDQIIKTKDILKDLASYLRMEEAGVAFYSKEDKALVSRCAVALDDSPVSFPVGSIFNQQIADVLDRIKDEDCSYMFSNRNNLNPEFGKLLDVYGIKNGFFYFIKNVDDSCLGIIYIINKKKKSVNFNSYIKESLLVMAVTIAYYLKIGNIHEQLSDMKVRENNILKMANIASYTIDKSNYNIVEFTESFKDFVPNIEVGKPCYKQIFGLSSPCSNCPLATKNKVLKSFDKKQKVEVSYSINTKMSSYIELVVRNIENNEESRNKFDADYLVNTYYSFNERLKNLYMSQSKGYVQLLTIDNIKELIDAYGNEGFAFYIRCFTSDIIAKIPQISEIFLYKDDTLAFIFPESGKLDIIDVLEKVFEYSKNDYLNDGNVLRLSMAYETVKYPQEFTHPSDLMRYLEKIMMNRDKSIFPTDTIHIEENDFYRPASRKDYVLSIIEQAAKENKFIIKCQPVIKASTKDIYGGEILIRLSDDYRNTLLNTEELIAVAGEHNKLNTISDLLIDYVGNLYQQLGASVFKTHNFRRMSINVDYNYFKQEDFINKVADTIAKYHLPKHFLTFEVNEQNLAEYFDKFKNVVLKLKELDVDVVCDRYTGAYLSLDKLRTVEIKEIKTQADFVKDIDFQSDKLESLKKMMDFAKEQNIKMTLVGIENGQQYKLISAYDDTVSMQGYYFYHPLDVNQLIEAIRKTNNLN